MRFMEVRRMTSYETASELLADGQSAVALFTRGHNFAIGENGEGTTGVWALDGERARKVGWIVIYLQDERGGGALWRARNGGLEAGDRPGKKRGRGWNVKLVDLELMGHTDKAWWQFAGGMLKSQKEIRYVQR